MLSAALLAIAVSPDCPQAMIGDASRLGTERIAQQANPCADGDMPPPAWESISGCVCALGLSELFGQRPG